MAKKLFMILTCCLAVAMTACSAPVDRMLVNGKDETTVSRSFNKLPEFTGLSASNAFDVEYTVGKTRSVVVEVSESVLDNLRVEVKNGRLEIGLKGNINRSSNGNRRYGYTLKAKVTGPALKEIKASSSADIHVLNSMSVDGSQNISASSSGDISFSGSLTVSGNLNISVSSSGEVEMGDLSASYVNLASSSSGEIEIGDITTTKANISASSSSDISIESIKTSVINASASSSAKTVVGGIKANTVKGVASSSATVKLNGIAVDTQLTASTSGDINASGLKAQKGSAQASTGGDISCNVLNLTKKATTGGSVRNR